MTQKYNRSSNYILIFLSKSNGEKKIGGDEKNLILLKGEIGTILKKQQPASCSFLKN